MAHAELPSDASQFVKAARHQLRFYRKTWRFLGLLGFVSLIGVASTVLSIYFHDSGGSAAASLAGIGGAITTFGVIICAFVGGDALAMDFGGGTGYFMLVLPVRRSVLLLGRYVAALAAAIVLMMVLYLFGLITASWFFGLAAIPWGAFAESIGLMALFAAAALSTAFLFSSFFRSPAISMVTTILVMFLGFEILDGALSVTGVEPWFSLLYAGSAIALPFQGAPHKTVIQGMGQRVPTITQWNPYIWEGAVIMLGYFVVALVLSAIIYHFKESKG